MTSKIDDQGFWYQIPKEIVDSGNLVKAVIYGVISAVARTSGVCFAANNYLLEKIGRKDNEVISKNLIELEKEGWIVVEYIKDKRQIYLGPLAEKLRVGLRKNPHTPAENSAPTPAENSAHNKININQDKLTNFETFWKIYPRKVAKKKALQVWNKIKFDPDTLKQILAAVAYQGKSDQWRKDDGKFIPHPATWLNAERWNDETKKEEPVQIARPMARNEIPQAEKREISPEAQKAISDARSKLGSKFSMP